MPNPATKPKSVPKTKPDYVLDAALATWRALFSSPVHLDSAIFKVDPRYKTFVARSLPPILRKPVSIAEAIGVGVNPGEPWIYSGQELADWKAMPGILKRVMEALQSGVDPAAWEADVQAYADDFPEAFRAAWEKDWGAKVTASLVQALASSPPLGLRLSPRLDPEEFVRKLKASATLPVAVTRSTISPWGVRLAGYAEVMRLPEFEAGQIEIQDEGSQRMCAFALWPELFPVQPTPGPTTQLEKAAWPETLPELPAWTIVDACAGAGGKTLGLAAALGGKGRVYAYDVSAKKLQALRSRAKRAGLNNIQGVAVTEGDEIAQLRKFRNSANLVLVDAPCSGWGVLKRNPDLKWRQGDETLRRMPDLQLRILDAYSRLTAPGGRLVYGVCTFRKEETTDIVQKFLESEAGARFTAGPGGYVGPDACDGFFMQSFTAREKAKD